MSEERKYSGTKGAARPWAGGVKQLKLEQESLLTEEENSKYGLFLENLQAQKIFLEGFQRKSVLDIWIDKLQITTSNYD